MNPVSNLKDTLGNVSGAHSGIFLHTDDKPASDTIAKLSPMNGKPVLSVSIISNEAHGAQAGKMLKLLHQSGSGDLAAGVKHHFQSEAGHNLSYTPFETGQEKFLMLHHTVSEGGIPGINDGVSQHHFTIYKV